LTRTVRDCALVFDVIAGHDPRDPASARAATRPTADAPGDGLPRVRAGVVEELFERHVTAEVAAVARQALADLERLGVEIEPVALPHASYVGATIMPLIQAEATSYHWPTLVSSPELYSDALRENLRLGATVLAKDYLAAQRARRVIQDEVEAALRRVDVLVFPTQPIVAPPLHAYQLVEHAEADVLDVEIGHTGLANLTGHPALSVPCGFTPADLPVGLQFTGRAFDEQTILQLGLAYEQATTWHTRRPRL
jgi:aspartyl-tRNA(Asn)/glutamyl-tRNA(Gln) amidotransferase subunit A